MSESDATSEGAAAGAGAAAAEPTWKLDPEEAKTMMYYAVAALVICVGVSAAIWQQAEPGFYLQLSIQPTTLRPISYDKETDTVLPEVIQTHVECRGTQCLAATRPGCSSASQGVLSVYLPKPKPQSGDSPLSEQGALDVDAVREALAASPHTVVVDSEEEACLVFPYLQGMDAVGRAESWGEDGVNHIVLDDVSPPCDAFGVGKAIRWTLAQDERCYWYHHDLVVPSSPALAAVAAGLAAESVDKDILLVVGGGQEGALQALAHDPPYVIREDQVVDVMSASFVEEEEALYRRAKYVAMDVLGPGGHDRVFRALAVGAIPVVIHKGYTIPILPLAEAVEWQHLVFFAAADVLAEIPERLYQLSDELHANRVATINAVLSSTFSSHQTVVDTALSILATRMAAVADGATSDPIDPLSVSRALQNTDLDIAYVPVLRDGVEA